MDDRVKVNYRNRDEGCRTTTVLPRQLIDCWLIAVGYDDRPAAGLRELEMLCSNVRRLTYPTMQAAIEAAILLDIKSALMNCSRQA